MNTMIRVVGERPERTVAVREAFVLRREIEHFQMNWPQNNLTGPTMPTFHWEALARQLTDLAVTPTGRDMAAALVAATRKQASWKPPEMVLREILCLAAVLTDPDFQPGLKPGEEVDMP